MKKVLCSFFMALLAVVMFAQKDVTTFLGIPVDGTKSEMKKKLISKGFEVVPGRECLQGEFNGTDVYVHIVTNNNKVYRIMLSDVNRRSEANIKVRFNRLIEQFKSNKRYMCYGDYTISDDVDISYEMNINNKEFQAVFYQNPDVETKETFHTLQDIIEHVGKKPVWFTISSISDEYYINMYYDNEYNHANGEDL